MSGPPLTVVVPLGGVGSRFQNEGHFARPKPFVRVFGKEMILWVLDNLSLTKDDELVIAFNPGWMCMAAWMSKVVGARYPRAHLVHLPGPTRGAAETVLLALQGVPLEVRQRPVMLCDGDTYYTHDIVGAYRAVAATQNASFVFHDTQPKPIYSYCTVGEDNMILETREKVKISDWANSGCYCFRSGAKLADECEALIKAGEMQLSQDKVPEYYSSGVIARLLAEGEPFRALRVEPADIHVLGTPSQVQEWCIGRAPPKQARFAFSLAALQEHAPHSSSPGPAADVVAFCKEMFAQGHHIKVLVPASGSAGGQGAESWLAEHDIKFHEIDLGGDPACDFMIRNSAIDPLLGSLDKQTGFYFNGCRATGPAGGACSTRRPSSSSMSSLGLGMVIGAAAACLVMRVRQLK